MNTKWKNEILLNQFNIEPKTIFTEYCSEIGIHFQNKGFKYFKSRPRIEKQFGDFVICINFWSSRVNEINETVWMEILPSIKSKSLKKWIKKYGVGRNEFIFALRNKQLRNLSIFGHELKDFQCLMSKIETVLISQLEAFEIALRTPKDLIDKYGIENETTGIIPDNFLAYICMTNPGLADSAIEKFGKRIEKSRLLEYEKWKKASREQRL
ncbi:hypothetical protein [Leeuwenhoekiella palythoae]|uniref:hypothetical protein n=1 Tax=Leeuwenhoekiella palythoae TaxID=573501 RepID=UPI0035153521